MIKAARSYVGVPFVRHQRTREGMDCLGLVLAVGADVGAIPKGYEIEPYYFDPSPDPALFDKYLPLFCREVTDEERREGDIGLMASVHTEWRPYHLVFLARHPARPDVWMTIGASAISGCERVLEMRWIESPQCKIIRRFRFRNLED